MQVLSKARRILKLSGDTPAAYEVMAGEIFIVETQDAMDGQIPAEGKCVSEVDATRSNPMTGPIRVVGVEPGQSIAVHILEMLVDPQGWMSSSPTGLVNSVEDTLAEFIPGTHLPIRPMIGVLGVAPPEGSYTGGDVTQCGGNMDIKEVGAGATVFFTANVAGANLVMGDVHALQADGECSGTGIEIGSKITMRIDVLDKGLSEWPYFYRDGVLSTVGTSENLRRACQIAVGELARIVSRASGLDEARSRMFLSLMADVHVGQFVCPLQSAYASPDLRVCPWPIHLGCQA